MLNTHLHFFFATRAPTRQRQLEAQKMISKRWDVKNIQNPVRKSLQKQKLQLFRKLVRIVVFHDYTGETNWTY